MILLDLDPAERIHLAIALRDRARQLRRDGRTLPARLVELADTLSQSRPATTGQPLPVSDTSGDLEPAWLLSSTEAARLLGCSTRTLDRRAAAGEVPSVQDGNRRRYRRTDLQQYVATLAPRKAAS
ncbi:helix-turn-helix domain-containing protein [Streptomyces sp. R39]|uniref:Helix-turn-helix domain-containing protein n=1 Tax=Streptomyces sp. R39 TaxID=3238631 RepID=A0AB39QLL1_9ACTN